MPPRFLFHKEREHHDAITEEVAQLLPRFSCFVVSPGSLKVGERKHCSRCRVR